MWYDAHPLNLFRNRKMWLHDLYFDNAAFLMGLPAKCDRKHPMPLLTLWWHDLEWVLTLCGRMLNPRPMPV